MILTSRPSLILYFSATNARSRFLIPPYTILKLSSPTQRADHEQRNAWIGPPFPLFLDDLPKGGEIPSQYHSLELGYSSKEPEPTEKEKRERGMRLEEKLRHEKEAAKAPGWE